MAKVATKKAKKPNGFAAPQQPDEILAAIVGSKPLSRGEIMKGLWKYIKKHDLQDKKDKRTINADDLLRPFFGKSKMGMFKMAKCVGAHITKA